MPYTLIVSGWRGATAEAHSDTIALALHPIHVNHGPNVLLRHGQCPYGGVDLICHNLAVGWGWTVEPWPPEIRDGRILGSPRNRSMCAAEPKADRLVAFPGPGSRGTWDCVRWAAKYGIPFKGVPLSAPGRR